jgi:hypothetical protein
MTNHAPSYQGPGTFSPFNAASRTTPWLPSGWGCPGRRLNQAKVRRSRLKEPDKLFRSHSASTHLSRHFLL